MSGDTDRSAPEVRENWRPPFCPDPTGCRPLIHPLTDPDNMALDKRGFAVFCWGRLAERIVWTFDEVEHVETLSSCQSSPLKGVVRWLENESDWSALIRGYRAAISSAADTENRP
jgi:hypothetical protein